MKIHHLNCISTCPLGGKLMDGRSPTLVGRGELSCHCLLVESDRGLVLVDTGLGLEDVRHPKERLSAFFLSLVKPEFCESMTARAQIERLGFDARDVRHIVLSHLDFDHAGGLDDFPNATIHLMKEERDYALLQTTWLDRQRFRPQQWSSRARWTLHRPSMGEKWFGFDCVRSIEGLPPEILLIPLRGHTFGHTGVAIQNGRGWLLYASDAYFFRDEMRFDDPRCTPGLRFYQTMMEKDRNARLANQKRLRQLKQVASDEITLFCAHDVVEFERLAGRSARLPVEALARPERVRAWA